MGLNLRFGKIGARFRINWAIPPPPPPRNDQLSYLPPPPPPRKNGKTLQKDVSKRKKMVDMFVARNQLADWSLFYMSIEKNFEKEKNQIL